MRAAALTILLCLLAIPAPLLSQQTDSFQQDQAARMLLAEGAEGLQEALEAAGVPPLTFNQETQVSAVHDSHVRVLETLLELEENGGSREQIEVEIQALEEQLLLAALKFLNPAQRTGLIGAAANAEFTELNSDLPEDEAELREYLTDLRSPAGTEGDGNSSGFSIGGGGGGGGSSGLLIDGFSGGRMPNRDEIQEIRINENSFTAEQSSQSRGRTEVITRGGVGRLNGDATFDFRDESLDARNAFASSRPPYQQRNFQANVSGPVIRNRLTMTFSMSSNNAENGLTLRALTPEGLIDDPVVRPTVQRSYTTRGTLQLSRNHNLNTSYQFGNQHGENQNVGDFGLPEQGSTSGRDNFTYQVKETAVLSGSFNNEARFQVNQFEIAMTPMTAAPYINVLGAFRAGGSPNNRDTKVRQFDFGDLLMYTGRNLQLRFGYDGGFTRINSNSSVNFNGTYTFSSLYDYCGIALGGFTTPQCLIELQNLGGPLAAPPPQGPTYSVSVGNPILELTQWQSAAYVQSDWKASSDLTLSLGLRYEWQTNLEDSNNIDPRLGFAYRIGSSTVLRGGTGIFHQRLPFFSALDLVRSDGTNQSSLEISESSYPVPFLDSDQVEVIVPLSRRVRAEALTAPYTWNNEATIETTLAGGLIFTASYRFIRGIHLFRDRNLNAPADITSPTPQSCQIGQDPITCVRPDPTQGNINQFESTGTSSSHTFRVGIRQRYSFLNLNGSYDFDSTFDDVPGSSSGSSFSSGSNGVNLPADNYDLDSEWGRSGARHRLNVSANVRFPWNVNANTIFNWNSGSPYTHETGRDDNLDTTRNDRPPGVPRNSLTGPGFFEMGFNLSKAIQLRSEGDAIAVNGNGTTGQGPLGSGGYYGQRTGVRMTISAVVENLLNNVNFQSFSGIETSSFFQQPTRARDGRRITLSVRFDF